MPPEMRLTRALVNLLPASVEDPGPMAIVEAMEQDNYHQRTATDILSKLPQDGELWVFAFGSLIWKPRFSHVERRCCTLNGWRRLFCLGYDERYRGNPDAPGLMLSLDKGGQCEGVVFRLAADKRATELVEMLETEPPLPPEWVEVQTPEGPVRCIALVSREEFPGYLGGLCEDDVADLLSSAVGMYGSMPDYLHNTIVSLSEVGIHDPYLWRMQDLVATRLEKLAEN